MPGDFEDMQFVVLSGPSGSGKTTIVECLLAQSPVKLVKSVSATTRTPRKTEVDGVNYYFLTPAEFATRYEKGINFYCLTLLGFQGANGHLRSLLALGGSFSASHSTPRRCATKR